MKTAYTNIDRAYFYLKTHADSTATEIRLAIDSGKSASELSGLMAKDSRFTKVGLRWCISQSMGIPPPTREFKPLDTRVIRPLIVRPGALEYRDIPSYLAGAHRPVSQ